MLVIHILFYIPIVGPLLRQAGAIPNKAPPLPLTKREPGAKGGRSSSQQGFVTAVTKGGRPLLLLPGGADEAFKPVSERFKLLWPPSPGFSRLICSSEELGSKTAVIPVFTRNCEGIFWCPDRWRDRTAGAVKWLIDAVTRDGQLFLVPVLTLVIFFSVGFWVLPLPVKLDTYLGPPLRLNEGETAEHFAARVKAAVEDLMAQSNAKEGGGGHTPAPAPGHRETPAPRSTLENLQRMLYGLIMALQNLVFVHLLFALTALTLGPLLLLTVWGHWCKWRAAPPPSSKQKNQ